MNERDQELLTVFRSYQDKDDYLRVFFRDGEGYEMNIVSTMHAEEGGDIVADVIRVIHTAKPEFRWDEAAMNFVLSEVVKVESGDKCLFTESI